MIAIARQPSPNLTAGERTFVQHSEIDGMLAARQHAEYCRRLGLCGIDVVVLPPIAALPDSTFVEDTAIVLEEVAVLLSMGAASRREEPRHIEPSLRAYREIKRMELPATIDGGDVLRIGRTLVVGRSGRTNDCAIAELERLGKRLGYDVIAVEVRSCLHLKTACTALPDGRLLVNARWIDAAPLAHFTKIETPQSEPWGANVLPVGENVLIDAAHTATAAMLEGLGFCVQRIGLSEFAKAEGGVTCLSLLVP